MAEAARNLDTSIDETTAEPKITENPSSQIPESVTFQNDPDGHKKILYEILREAYFNSKKAFTKDELTRMAIETIRKNSIKTKEPTPPQVTGHLRQIGLTLAKYGISIIAEEKGKGPDYREVAMYRLNIFEQKKLTTQKGEKKPEKTEDTEINPIKFVESLKSILTNDEYQLALVIAQNKEGITLVDLTYATPDDNTGKLDDLRRKGASTALIQNFAIISTQEPNPEIKGKTTTRYKMVIYKPVVQEHEEKMEEPKTIKELQKMVDRTSFDIRETIKALILITLDETAEMEKKIPYVETDQNKGEILKIKRDIYRKICSRIKDILKTLGEMSKKNRNVEISVAFTRKRLESILKQLESAMVKEFPKGLRSELEHLY